MVYELSFCQSDMTKVYFTEDCLYQSKAARIEDFKTFCHLLKLLKTEKKFAENVI